MASENSYEQLIDDFENGIMVLEDETLSEYIKRMGGVDYNSKADGGLMVAIERFNQGGMAGNKTYHQVRDQFMPMDSESMGYANGGGIGTMMKPKSKTGKAINQLQSKAPEGEFLAYINPDEAAMLKRAGGSGEPVNGIPSFRPQDMGNEANQAASSRNTGMGGMGAGRTDGGDNSRGGNAPTGDDFRRSQREFIQKVNNDNAIRANQTGTRFEPYRGGSRPKGFFAPNGGLSTLARNINPMSLLTGLATGNPFGILASLFGKGFKGIKGFNDKLQNSDFGQATSLADYFDMKKYGGLDARNLATQKNMKEAADITARLEGNSMPKTNVIMPGGPQYNLDNFGTGKVPSGPGYELSGFQQPTTITGGINSNDFDIGRTNQNDFFGVGNVDNSLTSNQINDFSTGDPSQYGLNSNAITEFATSPQFKQV